MRKTVKYKGTEVVYSQLGGGETILLLHGFLEERSMWDDYLEDFAEHFNVICVDLLGQGETGCLGYIHSMNDQALAVSTVLEAESVGKFQVVGHSMGGYVALELAHLYPERVEKLVLFHSTAFADSEDRKKDRERVIKLAQRNKDVYVKTVIPSLFAERTKDALRAEIDNLIRIAREFSKQGIIANIRGMMERPSRTDVLQNGAFPKLMVHGELDPIIQSADVESQSRLNGNIGLKTVEGIGHMGHLEATNECLRILMDFCTS